MVCFALSVKAVYVAYGFADLRELVALRWVLVIVLLPIFLDVGWIICT